ncbi:MAG: hypothetical protein KAG19_05470 [Methylococcales bacterium]|nr:hypothetical protein [Methylococcales bacterium]
MIDKQEADQSVKQAALKTLDLKQLEKQVNAVLDADLYWFPVRHHSPIVSQLLQQVIRQRKPKIIFIEGPSDCNNLIPHILNSESKPPIALYSSYRDDDNVLNLAGINTPSVDIPTRLSSWYPMLAYSPEYVALKTAKEIDALSCFIDLPHHALYTPFVKGKEDESPSELPIENKQIDLITQSDFYCALAESAGYSSWEETWDSLFEFGAYNSDPEIFRRELATFCAASRLTTSKQQMEQDGTYQREAYMRHTIKEKLAEHQLNESQAMVICGGFHLFMDHAYDQFPTPPKGTNYNSLVPYSFFRVSELSGYRAGNRAPQFYQLYWSFLQKNNIQALLPEYIVSVLKKGRQKGEILSAADAISIVQHAQMLSQLRQRSTPILEDLHDAIMACCCKGDPDYDGLVLKSAIDEIDIGRVLGKVTNDVGRLPLAIDFYDCLQKLELNTFQLEEKRVKQVLNQQEDFDRQRSAFLHQIAFLKIPAATLVSNENQFSAAIFKETWILVWSPDIDAKLVEENLYGDTIESATMTRLQESIAKQSNDASACCRILYEAIKMALPCLIQQLQTSAADAIANDTRMVSLAQALNYLGQIEQYSSLHQIKKQAVQRLIVQAYNRACFAIPDSATTPQEKQYEIVEALKIIAEIVFKDKSGEMDIELLHINIQSAATLTDVPFLKGAFYGLLAELKVIPSDEVIYLLAAYAKAMPDILVQSGDFLEGLLSVSRTSIVTGSPQLIEAIEELFKQANHESFLIMLPKIRQAFEKMNTQSKHAIADKVAQKHGLKKSVDLVALNTSLEAALLISQIDGQVDKIMQKWGF